MLHTMMTKQSLFLKTERARQVRNYHVLIYTLSYLWRHRCFSISVCFVCVLKTTWIVFCHSSSFLYEVAAHSGVQRILLQKGNLFEQFVSGAGARKKGFNWTRSDHELSLREMSSGAQYIVYSRLSFHYHLKEKDTKGTRRVKCRTRPWV